MTYTTRAKKKPPRIDRAGFRSYSFQCVLYEDKDFSHSGEAGRFQLLGDAADQDLFLIELFSFHGLALQCLLSITMIEHSFGFRHIFPLPGLPLFGQLLFL